MKLSIYTRVKLNPIKTMFAYMTVFERYYIIYRPDLHHLQTNRKNFKSS